MKFLVMTLMLVAATTALASPVAMDDQSAIDGLWAFSFQTADGVVSAEANLTVVDGKIQGTLTSPSGDLTVFGSATAEYVRIYASLGDLVVASLSGERTPGKISGSALFNGSATAVWTAARK